ncbi:uncharacterized protein JN550_002625 [Neoarthrinium moseri]|uniref:uncharacterized protein n=1 Tax=Neoarthrinium moseri TaxID=1658444 RepID=UPI001FDD0EF1|nr:uncharacterized protein JN550_002625 [Neoarthrinium moseri]KAI1874046.1 hypothetical protein JN550_002625 [Neoarthrinium moseri]
MNLGADDAYEFVKFIYPQHAQCLVDLKHPAIDRVGRDLFSISVDSSHKIWSSGGWQRSRKTCQYLLDSGCLFDVKNFRKAISAGNTELIDLAIRNGFTIYRPVVKRDIFESFRTWEDESGPEEDMLAALFEHMVLKWSEKPDPFIDTYLRGACRLVFHGADSSNVIRLVHDTLQRVLTERYNCSPTYFTEHRLSRAIASSRAPIITKVTGLGTTDEISEQFV